MNNILIDIFVPVIAKRYQVLVPYKAAFKTILPYIERMVQELSFDAYVPSGEAILCLSEDGEILDNELSAQSLGLENGASLFLI